MRDGEGSDGGDEHGRGVGGLRWRVGRREGTEKRALYDVVAKVEGRVCSSDRRAAAREDQLVRREVPS